jgi:cell division control protein 24
MTSTGGPPALTTHQSFQSQYSSYSHSTLRDTQSTQSSQNTSTTTLFGPGTPFSATSTPVNGGPTEAANNVLNKRADKDTSLFQRCLNLHQRLRMVPGFERWMIEEQEKADDDADPVTLLWRTFRRGYPLMEVYNALGPKTPLCVDETKIAEKNRPKTAAYKFIEACVEELKFPKQECFIVSDLYGDDTTGFVKVSLVLLSNPVGTC